MLKFSFAFWLHQNSRVFKFWKLMFVFLFWNNVNRTHRYLPSHWFIWVRLLWSEVMFCVKKINEVHPKWFLEHFFVLSRHFSSHKELNLPFIGQSSFALWSLERLVIPQYWRNKRIVSTWCDKKPFIPYTKLSWVNLDIDSLYLIYLLCLPLSTPPCRLFRWCKVNYQGLGD